MKDFNDAIPKCEAGNLLYLVQANRPFQSMMTKGLPPGVNIDPEAGTWTFYGNTYAIGSKCPLQNVRVVGDPIGVYDMMNKLHLKAMEDDIESVRAWCEMELTLA